MHHSKEHNPKKKYKKTEQSSGSKTSKPSKPSKPTKPTKKLVDKKHTSTGSKTSKPKTIYKENTSTGSKTSKPTKKLVDNENTSTESKTSKPTKKLVDKKHTSTGSKTSKPTKKLVDKENTSTGSKTSKPKKLVDKIIQKPKKSATIKIDSGSKTAKPQKKYNNGYDTAIDVNKIFDIIQSENKKKMEKNLKERSIANVIGTLDDTPSKIVVPTKITKETTERFNSNPISQAAMQSYHDAKQFLNDHNITISTITLDCKLHTLIDVDKFAKNVILREDEIVSVKFGNRTDPATNRTIVVIKSKKKPSVKNFYNQVTILMKPTNNPTRNYINIKVFKNGSLQMTGCKDMDDFNNVTNTLIKILKRGKDYKNKKGKTVHVNFIEDPKKIGIFDVKIRMINSNFKLDYKIDRKKLARLLKKNHRQTTKNKDIGYVECKYEPTGGHSCVNIKYKYDDKSKPSIFVFQTGAIIITGAKKLHHIIMSYHFIHKILNKYYNEIRIIDLDHKAVQTEIANFFKNNNNKKNEPAIDV